MFRHVLGVMLILVVSSPLGVLSSTGLSCITNCTGLPNADYQSCESCTEFLACIDNVMYMRNCPPNKFWHDALKLCVKKSTTCSETAVTCVDDCSDKKNGFYQSCTGCDEYTMCMGNQLIVMPCYGGLIWDDYRKLCYPVSATCLSDSPLVGQMINPIDALSQLNGYIKDSLDYLKAMLVTYINDKF